MLRSQVVVWCVCFGLPFCEALQWMVLGKKPLFSLVLTWLRFFLPRRGPLWKAKSWQYTGEKKLGRPPGRLGLRHKDPSSQAGLPSNGNNKVLLYCSLTMCRADGQLIGNWVLAISIPLFLSSHQLSDQFLGLMSYLCFPLGFVQTFLTLPITQGYNYVLLLFLPL